jgi:oligopeptide transport system permease protein
VKLKEIFANKSILFSTLLIISLALMAFFGPMLSPYTFEQTELAAKNLPPALNHIFGTDDLGRDLFTRVCHGLQISFFIGILAAGFDIFFGVTWGIIAAMSGKTIDQIMMKIAEMVYSFPYLVFVILVTSIIGPGIVSIVAGMMMVGWINTARISREMVLQIKHSEYVTASLSLGSSPFGIIVRHIVPNITGPIIALIMLTIPQAIFVEAFLSFLGIGIQPPMASLGSLVSDAWSSMRYYPWKLFIPASVITLMIFAFNLLGDGLREFLDPKAKKQLSVGGK